MRVEKLRRKVQITHPLLRGAIGEFIGTFLLIFIGECIVAQTHLRKGPNAWINVNLGWGFAITFCVFIVARISDAIDYYDGGERSALDPSTGTAGIFTTFAPEYLSFRGVFIDQIVGTGVLALFAVAILDKKNKIPDHLHALLIGFVVMMIGTAFGYPYSTYFLAPLLAPFIGAIAGGWLYYFISGYHIPEEKIIEKSTVEEKELLKRVS